MIRENIQAKVTIIGNANAGKSSIVNRFINETHMDGTEPTIGANFLTKTLDFEKFSIKLSIWDTAGQERYSSLASSYTRGSTCCLLVYDITNHESFRAISKWLTMIQENLDSDCILFVLGNKEDLLSQEQVSLEEAQSYCRQNDLTHYRVSAKSGEGIEDVFVDICKKLMGSDSLALTKTITSLSAPRGFSVCEPISNPSKKKCC